MKLTVAEKQEIKALIDRSKPLPVRFRARLFPRGALDESAYDRTILFNKGFKQLLAAEWTTTHFTHKLTIPPLNVQAAWPWRREIWTLYFLCRRSVGRAHCRYTTGEWAEWSDTQRELERLGCLSNAFSTHNGMEDRIAQLANCFNVPPQAERKVSFCRFFKEQPPATLPKTNAKVAKVCADTRWQETHNRANSIKHHWTGEMMSQLPAPEQIRRQLAAAPSAYLCYGPIKIKPDDVDRICESAQQSLNLLVDLATTIDKEIGWEKHFHIAGE